VAAALYGGFVICPGPGEPPVRFDPAPGLEGVLAIPDHEVATSEARAAMPAEVPVAEAVHNVGHAALLVLGLSKDDFSLIGRGLRDRVHQPRRRSLYPRSMELVERAEELGAVGATISGAGPTVLFWCHWQQTGGLVDRLKKEASDCEVRRVTFAPGGADVREL
jgi:homoserine kinase